MTSLTHAKMWDKSMSLPGEQFCKKHHEKTHCYKDGNNKNIYRLDELSLKKTISEGAKHLMYYPVTTSRLQIPYQSFISFFKDQKSPLRQYLFEAARSITKNEKPDDIYAYLGLHHFPKSDNELGPNLVWKKVGDEHRMGVQIWGEKNEEKLTFGCAACHSNDLFGVKVMGMTNRFPKANDFFVLGKKLSSLVSENSFKLLANPSKEDLKTYQELKSSIRHIGVKKPLHASLDTSLAQVALSLAKRNQDQYASYNHARALFPRKNALSKTPADSKPMPWWNLKYKTKWLADGSVISGNPIFTNILWNEIGRGADLKKLEKWIKTNHTTIKSMTAYAFNTVAPKYNDFFPGEISISKAQRGQKLFVKNCAGCHGTYEKGWDNDFSNNYEDKIQTTKTWYHEKTPTIDVGTDPYRYKGMKAFEDDLNRLKISKTLNAKVKSQKGYIPPPLVGIWSRWPYFHNNSVPTLYDVLTPDFKRPKSYYATPSLDKDRDFNFVFNGYPRAPYKKVKEYYFDTRKKGMSNMGHTKMLMKDGKEKFSHQQKLEIIEFLKTL